MPSHLRVLHVVGAYPTEDNPHNQMFIKTQVDSLSEAGIECDVLTLQGAGFRKYVQGKPQVRKALNAKTYDLIHAHYSFCGWAGMGLGLPLVSSFLGSDLYGKPRQDGSFPMWSKVSHLWIARRVADRSAARIVKSQAMQTDLQRQAHVVPNGVDCDRFHPVSPEEKATLKQELGLKADTRHILFAGNPDLPRKRFALAVAAVEKAQASVPFPLKLMPLSGQTHETVIKHMQASDMLILTSSLEGSPNVVKEAMAANMRLVAVEVGDTRERLHGVSGCRCTSRHDAASVGAAVAEIFNSDEPSEARKAVQPLHMPLVAEQIRAIYEEALGQGLR